MADFDALWDFNDPAATEQRFLDALKSASIAERLEIRTQIARTYSLRRQFDEATKILDEVRQELTGNPARVHIRFALELGRIDNSAGRKPEACGWFEIARALARLLNEEPLEIDAIHMLGIADADRSDDWNLMALDIARNAENPKSRKWLGSLLNNLGWSRFSEGSYEESLRLFQEALSAREDEGDAERIRVAQWCVGRTFRALNRTEEAFAIMRELERGPDDVYVNEELAHLYFGVGESVEAARYARRALEFLRDDYSVVNNEPDRIAALEDMVI